MPWRRVIALPLLVVLLAGPAGAGTADQVGATFGLLIQDVVSAFPPAEGLVVAAEGDRLFIDLTEKSGVQPGQEYSVFRKGEAFRHPINGRPLGRYEDVLGYAQIVRLHPQYTEALFVPAGGKPTPEPEDGVRITKGRIRVAVAPATDLTKAANADLRRVPFMLANALEQTKRFQVADPTLVQEHLLSQKTRSEELLVSPDKAKASGQDPGGLGLAGPHADRAAGGDLPGHHLDLRGDRYGPVLPAGGPDPDREHGRAAVPLGACSDRLSLPPRPRRI